MNRLRLTLGLVATNVLLGAVLAWVSAPAQWPSRLAPYSLTPLRSTPDLSATIAVRAEATLVGLKTAPLFYRSRALVVVNDPTQLAASRPQFILVVSIQEPRGTRVAYLRPTTSGDTVRVRVGDDLGGWTVTAIDLTRVVAERGGQQVEIVAATHLLSPGLVRVANPSPSVTTAGYRTLRASNTAIPVRAKTATEAREARTYRPPPAAAIRLPSN
jgi:hypothetical protein